VSQFGETLEETILTYCIVGLGQANASRLNQSFTLFSYLTPILGAVVADQYLGRFKTILFASIVFLLGLLTLIGSSLSIAHDYNISTGGLMASLLLLGVGSGGIKPNVNPLIAEQYTGIDGTIQVIKSGETVLLDRALTLQR
jgi:proton-dependent oligopeptide transporter, POT family